MRSFYYDSFQHTNFGIAGERMTFRLRLKMFRAYLRQDAAYFDDPKHGTGSLTTRLATDASLIKTVNKESRRQILLRVSRVMNAIIH